MTINPRGKIRAADCHKMGKKTQEIDSAKQASASSPEQLLLPRFCSAALGFCVT